MRLKLVIGASSLAALVGAGSCIAIVQLAFSSFASPGLLVGVTFLLPAAAITIASIFVYRHTARRRKLQAFLTVLISLLLTLCLFVGAYLLNARRIPREPITRPGPPVAKTLPIANFRLAIVLFPNSESTIP